MPHSQNEIETMSQTMVNGDKPSSQFLSHLKSYPVVNDSISTFKSNPYGKKSLDLADTGFETFVKPVLPYAQKPYDLVAPIVAKADAIADGGLKKVDQTFPIVKEDTSKIKGTVRDYAFFPFRLAGEGKDYALNTYSSEYKKCGGDGMVAGGKAIITTGLVFTSDSLAWISSFLGSKKEQAGGKMEQAGGKMEQAKNAAKEKTNN